MKRIFCILFLTVFSLMSVSAQEQVYEMSRYGIKPGKTSNMTVKLQKALSRIAKEAEGEPIVLNFQKGNRSYLPCEIHALPDLWL